MAWVAPAGGSQHVDNGVGKTAYGECGKRKSAPFSEILAYK